MEPAVLIAIVSLILSVYVAVRSERRADRIEIQAKRAEERAERAEANAEALRFSQLWGDLTAQIQPFVSIILPNPHLSERLLSLRSAATELIDNVDPADWLGLDTWLVAEHQLGALMGEATLANLGSLNAAEPDAIIAAHEPLHLWAYALQNNVRYMRRIGPGDESREALPLLLEDARERIAKTCREHGRPVPVPPAHITPLHDVVP